MSSRPFGITVLTVTFEVLAVACAYVGAKGLFGSSSGFPTSTALLFLINAAISGLVALGLHRRRWWCRRAARFWSASAALLFIYFFFGPDHGLPVAPFAEIPFASALVGFCWLLEIYVPYAFDSAA